MKIWNVPIEDLEERYSAQWNTWFPEEFDRRGIEFETISGVALTRKIETGSFLDVYGTNYFKASQLMEMVRRIYVGDVKKGDVFFVHDLWFPGLEMLAYIRDGAELDFKVMGILHAGTYDPYDFLSKQGMGSWASPLEHSWFKIVDKIFVATEFHKQLILETRNVDPNKLIVTGLPIYDCFIKLLPKEDIVVFPHRLDEEKNPEVFQYMSIMCQKRGWKFLRTKDDWTTKDNYYRQLSMAKVAVSFADQETWGIAMQEALFCRCFPVVPDRLSYSEMYLPIFKYDDHKGAEKLIRFAMENYYQEDVQSRIVENRQNLLDRGSEAIGRMIWEMVRR